MENLQLVTPIVDAEFLFKNLERPNLVILDATKASSGQKDFAIPTHGISSARFINLKEDFADKNSSLPNTLLPESDFEKAAQNLGVNSDSAIVVYDQKGMYSSPRVYWMFKAMGHQNIAVLNGGYKAWTKLDLPIEELKIGPFEKGNFISKFNSKLIISKEDIHDSLADKRFDIFDARSSGRFNGTEPEPRPILRSGHIPHSCSLPHTVLKEDGTFLPEEELKQQFETLISSNKPIVFTCGSGITACILFLAAEIIGYEDIAVYDGSWSEWGLPSDLPVQVNSASN